MPLSGKKPSKKRRGGGSSRKKTSEMAVNKYQRPVEGEFALTNAYGPSTKGAGRKKSK
jgi:hypothetical protein